MMLMVCWRGVDIVLLVGMIDIIVLRSDAEQCERGRLDSMDVVK